MSRIIYKICDKAEWQEAQSAGVYSGAPIDLQDGFIHFSSAAQVAETAAKHFAGRTDLLLLSIDENSLGSALKWEPSRGGDLFPHLYAPLPLAAVQRVSDLRWQDGTHLFPELAPQ